MLVSTVPLVDLYKSYLAGAEKNGFILSGCLIARQADSNKLYENLFDTWTSLHDLTGNNVCLFFAGHQKDRVELYISNGDTIGNKTGYHNGTSYSQYPFYSFAFLEEQNEREVIRSHTLEINALKEFFNIREKELPCLIITLLDSKENFILPILNSNFYDFMKSFIINLEDDLLNYKIIKSHLIKEESKKKRIDSDLDRVNNTLKRYDCNIDELKSEIISTFTDDSIFENIKNVEKAQINVSKYISAYKTLKAKEEIICDLESCDKVIDTYRDDLRTVLLDISTKLKKYSDEKVHNSSKIILNNKRRFKIAVSFAGEHRNYIENTVNELLERGFTKNVILYDMFHEAEFARPNLDIHLYNLYSKDSELVVVFLSKEYNEKQWTGLEYRAIRKIMNDRINDNSIMLIRFGNHEIDGLSHTTDGSINAHSHSWSSLAELIIQRYEQLEHIT